MIDPADLVKAQLAAYNARDIDRFAACFSNDVRVYSLNDNKVLLEGIAPFRENYQSMFADSPNLHAEVTTRLVRGDFVIDEETVTGRRGETISAIAIYRITAGKISHVWFAR